jgi:GAF domain-containing protein
MPREQKLARTFVELADTLTADFDVLDLLDTLVTRCVDLLDAAACGLLLADPEGHLHVMAASTEQIHLVELFQLQNHEGPCLEAFHTGRPVINDDLSTAMDRWPRFAAAARDAGYDSVQAVPLKLRDQVVGALNLFHAQPSHSDPLDRELAQALADVATIALLQSRALNREALLAEQLQGALNSRIILEQAKGVTAERLGVEPAAAFALLRDHARAQGLLLSEYARGVVEGTAAAPAASDSAKTGQV